MQHIFQQIDIMLDATWPQHGAHLAQMVGLLEGWLERKDHEPGNEPKIRQYIQRITAHRTAHEAPTIHG